MNLSEIMNWLRPAVLEMQQDGMSLADAETIFRNAYIGIALSSVNGHEGKAAAMLNVHRNTIIRSLDPDARRRKSTRPKSGCELFKNLHNTSTKIS